MDIKPTTKTENADMFNWQMAEVLNNINIGFFSKDVTNNKYLSISEGCPKIYGYTLADFYENGNLWYDVILDEDKHVTEEEIRVLSKGEKSTAEYRIRHRDNSIRWLEVKTLPVFEGQALTRVEGIVYDITDRKNTEIQVIKAKELSENILDSLPGIFYLFDEEGRYVNWNKNFEKITGFSGNEIASLNPFNLVITDDQLALENAIKQVLENGWGEVEARMITKTGKVCMYYFTGQKVVIEGKSCVAGMGIDISKRKAAEEKLQKNEKMLSHILDLIPQSIFWKDASCNFMGGNSVFAGMVGVEDVAQVIGKNDFDFSWSTEEAKKYQKDDMAVMKSKKPRIHYIETLTQNNGETTWLDTTKIPLKDQNDEVYGILVVIDDITEKKLKEDKQKKINEDLIKKNIGLKDFSYIVSHNLRSPISKILGLASLFEKENQDAGLNDELIGHIVNEVSNLDIIVKDLNSILAHQSLGGRIMETLSLDQLLLESKQSFENEIRESAAHISYNFERVKTVKTVKSYLHNILNNLICNALKFKHPDRPPAIHIESFDYNQFVCITVQDNGLGIDLVKYGNKVFGLYNNFHLGTAHGRGIGLTLAKTQAEALGGTIELESCLKTGSIFKVYLPQKPAD